MAMLREMDLAKLRAHAEKWVSLSWLGRGKRLWVGSPVLGRIGRLNCPARASAALRAAAEGAGGKGLWGGVSFWLSEGAKKASARAWLEGMVALSGFF